METTKIEETQRSKEGFGSTGLEELNLIKIKEQPNAYVQLPNCNILARDMLEELQGRNEEFYNLVLNALERIQMTILPTYFNQADLQPTDKVRHIDPVMDTYMGRQHDVCQEELNILREEVTLANPYMKTEDDTLSTILIRALENRVTNQHISQIQDLDPEIRILKEDIAMCPQFRIEDDIIYKLSFSRLHNKVTRKLCLPAIIYPTLQDQPIKTLDIQEKG